MSAKATVYEGGKKVEESHSLDDAVGVGKDSTRVAWISLIEPTGDEVASAARRFGLEGLAAKARRRAESKYHGRSLALMVSPAEYRDDAGKVEVGELEVLLGDGFAITVSRGPHPDLDEVEADLEENPLLSSLGSGAVLCTVLYRVADDFKPVVDGLQDALTDLEADVLGRNGVTIQKIYELAREVVTFQRATGHLVDVLERLTNPDQQGSDVASGLGKHLRGVRDRTRRMDSRVSGFAGLLQNLLSVNLTLVSVEQNDQTRKISAWAAMLAVPTVIGGVYGMNFRYMPELDWPLGYPFALLLMLAICLVLYVVFRRIGWL